MFQVRVHGRGGQGVITAAELLALAAIDEGRYAQVFSGSGRARKGAPAVALCRFSEEPIWVREPVATVDALIVLDATLIHQIDLLCDLAADGHVILNSNWSLRDLGLADLLLRLPPARAATVPASAIARRHLGCTLPNATMLGGFAALTGEVGLASLRRAIHERLSGPAGGANATAAAECFYTVQHSIEAPSGA
jgi:pyruvate ferredoxin oxidoreductase gamma subunit